MISVRISGCAFLFRAQFDLTATYFQKLSYLQVTVFTSMHNIGYFSNFFYCSFGRPYAQVVTPDKNVTISALVDAGQPWRTTIGDNLVYTGRTVNDLFLSTLLAISQKFSNTNARCMAL